MAALLDCVPLTDLEVIDSSLVAVATVVAGAFPQGSISVPAIKATWSSAAAWAVNPQVLGIQFEYGPADLSYGPTRTAPQGKVLQSWAATDAIITGVYTYRYRAVGLGKYGPWTAPANLTVVAPNFAWGAGASQGEVAAAIGSIPPNASVGGHGNIIFGRNKNNVGGADNGEIQITGDTLYTDSRRTVTQTAIHTFFEAAGQTGRFYIIQGATQNTTRFPGFSTSTGGVGTFFIAVYDWATGQWSATDNAGSLYPFNLLGTDIIVGVGYRESGASAGIDSIQTFINTNPNLPEDGATVSRVFRQSTTPVGAVLNDIWVVLSGSTPIEVRAFNGTIWVTGADITELGIAAGITGQGPGATDPREPDDIALKTFAPKVMVGGFSAGQLARFTFSGLTTGIPPGGTSGQVRLTATNTASYAQLNAVNSPSEQGYVVRARVRGTVDEAVASQWRGLLRVYASAFPGGYIDKTVSFPKRKDGSTRLSTTAYNWAEWDISDDAGWVTGATVTAVRLYILPTVSGKAIDLDHLAVGSYATSENDLRGVSDGADQTLISISAGFTGQAPAATDPTIAPGAGSIDFTNATTSRLPSYYRAFGPIERHEQKRRDTVGVDGSGNLYGTLTTKVTTISTSYPIVQVFQFDDGVFQRQSTSESAWGAWRKIFDEQNKPNFASSDLLESSGVPATSANFKTILGISGGFSGQGNLSLLDSVPFGSSFIRETSGGAVATLNNFKTGLGISGGFTGQGALASLSVVRATQMDVGDTANSFPDADLTDVANYLDGNAGSAGKIARVSNTNTSSKYAIELGGGVVNTGAIYAKSVPFQLSEQQTYIVGAAGGSIGTGTNCSAYLGVRFYTDSLGTAGESATTTIWEDDTTDGRDIFKWGVIKPPAGTKSGRLMFGRSAHATSTDRAILSEPVVQKRAIDSRQSGNNLAANALVSVTPSNFMTPTNSGGARISIASFTVKGDFGSIVFNSGVITGLAYATKYFIYAVDPAYGGGAVTYVASTTVGTYSSSKAHLFLGTTTTLSSGGTGGTPFPPNPDCVQVDMFMLDGSRAGDAAVGDLLLKLNDDGEGTHVGRITGFSRAAAPCVHIETASGCWIVVSETTPITGHNGDCELAANVEPGRMIAVQDKDGFRWEPIASVRPVGEKIVAHISSNDGTYAAGGEIDRLVFTHNIYNKQ